ncbi:(6-4) photolyase [Devosia pacifica]|uniref:(6-4) photolyase n=1 Tax=Devosia pacifica TaxID=1335967 RepID=A0A918VR29_9HYPH|nr:cryptochrome/photolyase family protein [Devosia pacifica]GHA20931.1 (6-4) photolyase [Devosia pacifica]
MQLVVVLGDQLTLGTGPLEALEREDTVILMAEVGTETTYAWHHKQKLVLVLSAMRHFAEDLRAEGWHVDYVQFTDDGNSHSLDGEVQRAVERHKPERIHVIEAAEWRVQQMLLGWEGLTGVPVSIYEDQRFICSHATFNGWAENRKQWTMEFFYREMRKQTGLLLDAGGEPVGGRWNFDTENRKPAQKDLFTPKSRRFEPDDTTKAVMELVADRFGGNPGSLEQFGYAVTREDAEAARDSFIDELLPRFGDYQDAMLTGEPTLYHSVLSAYINIGLLDPLDVCKRAEAAYEAGDVPLNCAEGFIRQILGWREYVRGVYWQQMPDYRDRNALEANGTLPWFYWDGRTDMHCMAEALGQTLNDAYAHHIQRLMITGNFALIAGIEPQQVHEWYLAIYIDAFEWVELPNTLGMSQFGDGGLLGSKPYAASANYINKMSDYCSGCRYARGKRHGDDACPFNFLYWDFLARHRNAFSKNTRMKRTYMVWDRFDEAEQKAIRSTAAHYLDALEKEARRNYATHKEAAQD